MWTRRPAPSTTASRGRSRRSSRLQVLRLRLQVLWLRLWLQVLRLRLQVSRLRLRLQIFLVTAHCQAQLSRLSTARSGSSTAAPASAATVCCGAGERRDSVLLLRLVALATPHSLCSSPRPSPPPRTVRAPASCGQGLKRPPRPGHGDLGVERLNKKPMSTAHKAKIAAGVKVSPQVPGAHKATSKPKPKPKPKPAPSNPDHGRQMRTVVDKLERRAAVQKNMARIRKIRGGSVVALAPNVN